MSGPRKLFTIDKALKWAELQKENKILKERLKALDNQQ
jgi:hypothetical protein